jgi:hypothetical protein
MFNGDQSMLQLTGPHFQTAIRFTPDGLVAAMSTSRAG